MKIFYSIKRTCVFVLIRNLLCLEINLKFSKKKKHFKLHSITQASQHNLNNFGWLAVIQKTEKKKKKNSK